MEPKLPPSDTEPRLPVIHVSELMGDRREVLIVHENQTYRLRITSNRKLILTK